MKINPTLATVLGLIGTLATVILMSKQIPADSVWHTVALGVVLVLQSVGIKATTDAAQAPSPAQATIIAAQSAALKAVSEVAPAAAERAIGAIGTAISEASKPPAK